MCRVTLGLGLLGFLGYVIVSVKCGPELTYRMLMIHGVHVPSAHTRLQVELCRYLPEGATRPTLVAVKRLRQTVGGRAWRKGS